MIIVLRSLAVKDLKYLLQSEGVQENEDYDHSRSIDRIEHASYVRDKVSERVDVFLVEIGPEVLPNNKE